MTDKPQSTPEDQNAAYISGHFWNDARGAPQMDDVSKTTKPGDRFEKDGWAWEVTEVIGDTVRTRRAGKIMEATQSTIDDVLVGYLLRPAN